MRDGVPRYVQFARSLALLGGLGAVSCGDEAKTGTDATTADASLDAQADVQADGETVDCGACDCSATTPDPSCYDVCCFVIGPLYPPDLAAGELVGESLAAA